jgi:adenine deaminase
MRKKRLNFGKEKNRDMAKQSRTSKKISGVIIDPVRKTRTGAEILIKNGKIASIEPRPEIKHPYIIPGFVDAHVHVESSMLIPSRFAAAAVKYGTVGVVADPHEVANVAGIDGIEFMISDAEDVPMEFYFGVPSCVPASPLEKSGAVITSQDVEKLIQNKDFYFLAEMMNFPGVLNDDEEVLKKLQLAKDNGKPIDGHAPGLKGKDAEKYVNAGIATDHECNTIEEAREKIELGMKVLIREGSAARNLEMLIPLITEHADMLMFCTDDCHPDYLMKGHINKVVHRAVKKGYDLFDVLKVACVNPVVHYNLPLGLLRQGDSADFVVVDDLAEFKVLETWLRGKPVFKNEKLKFKTEENYPPPFPFRKTYQPGKLTVEATGSQMNVMEAIDGELFTGWLVEECKKGEDIITDTHNDLLKIVLLDRYSEDPPVAAFVKGFGLKKGAMACSVAHDSHHIIAVGCDDDSLDFALEWVVKNKGGICFAVNSEIMGIPLPYFGLMSDVSAEEMAADYEKLSTLAKKNGSNLEAPFMTLSFMALTVIPELKINHKGLFDGKAFENISLFKDE